SEVEHHTGTLTQTLRTALPVGAEYHLMVLWSRPDEHDYVRSWDAFTSVRAPGIQDYIAYGAHRIRQNAEAGAARQRVVLLGLRWPSGPQNATEAAARQARDGLRSERARYRAAQARLDAVAQRIEDSTTQLAASPLRTHRASAGTIAWAWARQFRPTESHTIPANSEVSGSRLVNLAHGEIDPTDDPSYVVVRDVHTGQHSYVSVLVPAVNGFAQDLEIPGGEWLELLSEVPGVEASVRGVQHGQ